MTYHLKYIADITRKEGKSTDSENKEADHLHDKWVLML